MLYFIFVLFFFNGFVLHNFYLFIFLVVEKDGKEKKRKAKTFFTFLLAFILILVFEI